MMTGRECTRLLAGGRLLLQRCLARCRPVARCLPRLLVAALVLGTAATCRVQAACPSREFIYPCTCTETFIGNYVMCTVVREEQLRLPFQYLRDYNLSRLFISNVTSSLSPDIFAGLKVGTFKVADSRFKMEEVHQQGGPGVERWTMIQNLEFMRCCVDAGTNFFGALDELEMLSLQNSTVRRFSSEWIGALVNLTHLVVDMVSFDELDSAALADLSRLATLMWTGNGATILTRQFFPRRARYLKTIDLSDNKLTSLPHDMFDNMPVLENVMLSRNKFKTLSPAPWRPMLQQLCSIKLDGNPIDCSANISWLLQGDARHKISGTCATPQHLAGVNLSELSFTRYLR